MKVYWAIMVALRPLCPRPFLQMTKWRGIDAKSMEKSNKIGHRGADRWATFCVFINSLENQIALAATGQERTIAGSNPIGRYEIQTSLTATLPIVLSEIQ